MTDNLETLFDSAETLSPRLSWMRKHGMQTMRCELSNDEDFQEWMASITYGMFAYGDTEDEALSALASKLGIKMWNES